MSRLFQDEAKGFGEPRLVVIPEAPGSEFFHHWFRGHKVFVRFDRGRHGSESTQ
jgi:hypothetical protein